MCSSLDGSQSRAITRINAVRDHGTCSCPAGIARCRNSCSPNCLTSSRASHGPPNCRQFGGPWLALELVKQLGLHEFLQRAMPAGQEHVPWSLTALILVIARLCEPSSELHIAEHFYRQSALCDLLGVPI